MIRLFLLFVDICRLKANPQDVPSSHVLKYVSIIAYIAVGLAVSVLNQDMARAIIAVVVDTAMLIGLGYAGLWVRSITDRTTQTLTALAGTRTVFVLMGLPVLAMLQSTEANQPGIASLLLLLLNVWYVIVTGHILRHALSLPFWAGIGISIFYVYTSIRVMSVLFIAGAS